MTVNYGFSISIYFFEKKSITYGPHSRPGPLATEHAYFFSLSLMIRVLKNQSMSKANNMVSSILPKTNEKSLS